MGTAESQKNALELLIEQHDAIERLLDAVGNEPLIERKQLLLEELADTIRAHATLEDKLFYPTVRAMQTQQILLDSDHFAIRRVLSDLIATEVDDERFDAKLAVLAEELQQHTREDEEAVLFPKLRRLMSEEQLVALGIDMSALYDRLIAAQGGSVKEVLHRDPSTVRPRPTLLQ